jgi:hypothetical protein
MNMIAQHEPHPQAPRFPGATNLRSMDGAPIDTGVAPTRKRLGHVRRKVTGALLLWLASLGAILIGPSVQAQPALPDLSGTYRCVPDGRPCPSSTFTVSQSGSKLDVKSDQGTVGHGEVTSPISVILGPPWSLLGTILQDQRTIEWSAGPRWQK